MVLLIGVSEHSTIQLNLLIDIINIILAYIEDWRFTTFSMHFTRHETQNWEYVQLI